MAYDTQLLDSLRVKRPANWRPSPWMFPRGFVAPAQLSSTAWQSAADAGVVEHMPYLKVNPIMDPLRGEPRFEALVAKMGLSPRS